MDLNEYKFLIESNDDARSRVEAVFRSSDDGQDRADDLAGLGIISLELADKMRQASRGLSDVDFDDPRYRDEATLFNYLWKKYGDLDRVESDGPQ